MRLLFILFSLFYVSSFSQKTNYWKSLDKEKQVYELNIEFLKDEVSLVKPSSFTKTNSLNKIVVPVGEGDFEEFKLENYDIMDKGLKKKYPQLKVFKGQSTSNSSNRIICNFSDSSFNAVINKHNEEYIYIDPIEGEDKYAVKSFKEKKGIEGVKCLSPHEKVLANNLKTHAANKSTSFNSELRVLRLAVSATGEYSSLFKGVGTEADQKANVLSQIISSVSRVNEIFERELAVRFVLIEDTDNVIYLDGSTDPFSGFPIQRLTADAYSTLVKNNFSNVIGDSNFDIGHNFAVNVGGGDLGYSGGIGVLCSVDKGAGFTALSQPYDDYFDVDFLSHEIGHQLGAYHVMNTCGRNGYSFSTVEPGSGSSIMGYAGGGCEINGLFPDYRSLPYFNYVSIKEMHDHVSGSVCKQVIDINNSAPIASVQSEFTIPANTAFVLEGDATDTDGAEFLTYQWSQNDSNFFSSGLPESSWTDGAVYKLFSPSSSKKRYFPGLGHVLLGDLTPMWEVTPSVSRELNFMFTVRDNGHDYSGDDATGLVDYDDVKVNVVNTGNPFRVTSQAATENWEVGEEVTVNWDVAGTNANGINASLVDILLSDSGSGSFNNLIASGIPNNGSYTFNVPNSQGINFRVMVKGHNNVFYAINSAPINIGYFTNEQCYTFSSSPNLPITDNGSALTEEDIINVPSDLGALKNIIFKIDVDHSYIGDLQMELHNPSDDFIEVKSLCDNESGFKFEFKDSADNYINCASTSSFSEVKLPLGLLSDLGSGNYDGDWTLKIGDYGLGDLGVLNNWELQMCFLTATPLSAQDSKLNSFKVYPSSGSGDFYVSSENYYGDVKIQIFEINGKQVLEHKFLSSGSFEEPIKTNLSTGVYIVKIKDAFKSSVKKFVVY